MEYNLEGRTSQFGKRAIDLLKSIKETSVTKPILSQMIRSCTSVGANYREANGASSKRDFINKIAICRKEMNESKHWIEMLAHACPERNEELRIYWKEAHELTLIFNKIYHSSKNKK